jgi:hypothetical protein
VEKFGGIIGSGGIFGLSAVNEKLESGGFCLSGFLGGKVPELSVWYVREEGPPGTSSLSTLPTFLIGRGCEWFLKKPLKTVVRLADMFLRAFCFFSILFFGERKFSLFFSFPYFFYFFP